MYECVRIAPNRPKIQVYKNIINHKFIFNYHYNSALWSDRFKSVETKDPRTVELGTGRSKWVRLGPSEIFIFLVRSTISFFTVLVPTGSRVFENIWSWAKVVLDVSKKLVPFLQVLRSGPVIFMDQAISLNLFEEFLTYGVFGQF